MIDSLVVGNGEVGQAMFKVLQLREGDKTVKATDIKDPDFNNVLVDGAKILHICFPYSENFIKNVKFYVNLTKANFVIIHSTIQVGTTDELRKTLPIPAVHSPVQGQHSNLTEHILYFDKFIGTSDQEDFSVAA